MNKKNSKSKNSIIEYFSQYWGNNIWYNLLISVITLVIIAFVCIYFHSPNTVNWKVGDKATKTLIANSYVSYEDYKTEQYIQEEIIDKAIGYEENSSQLLQTFSNVKLIFNTIRSNRQQDIVTQQEINNLKTSIGPYLSGNLSEDCLMFLLSCDLNTLDSIETDVLDIENHILQNNLKEDAYYIRKAHDFAEKKLEEKNPGSKSNNIALEIIKNTLKPNLVYSESKTQEVKEEKKLNSPQIYRTLNPGDVIISKGDLVTEYNLELLKKSGYIKNNLKFFENSIGIIILILFAFVYVWIFCNKFNLLKHNLQKTILFAIIISACVLGFWLTGSILYSTFDTFKLGYIAIMWIVAAAMLVYNLISRYLSFFILAFLSVIISYSLGNDIRILALSIIYGMCALWTVSQIKARVELIVSFLILVLITVIQVFIFGLIYSENFYIIFTENIKYAAFTIPCSTLVYYIFSGILERFFDVTTDMRLIELANSNNHLLKNLAMKSPGTYIHSLSVSYIAEACAETINANVLLTRVGAYYHDIGKINNPQYYVENQYAENIHDTMTPQLSGMVIRSHVKLGVEYAKKYKLPNKVISLIREHHGTTLVSFFYNQFHDNNTDIINVESQFRYEGPKPQTKESAILMIADSVEAASRSLKSPTPNKIETMVNSIVSTKLSDGQFNECPLTLADISKIKLVCVKTLLHTLHKRIEYPQVSNKQENEIKDLNLGEEAQ